MKKICENCQKVKDMLPFENKCYSCIKLEALERSRDSIANPDDYGGIDTFSEDYVICPYCGDAVEVDIGYEEFPELYEDGDHELECDGCGKKFILETSVSYYYKTRRLE